MRKRILAAAAAAICLLACASCVRETSITVDENASGSTGSGDTELTVGELIEPKEGSAEYDLGSYRTASDGVKYYYDDNIPTELMFALDEYFTCFQSGDYEKYQTLIYPDYAERYSDYLIENYEYDLDESFGLSCTNLRSIMQEAAAGDGDPSEFTGDFTITRIKAEEPELEEGETTEELQEQLFSYFTEIFGMDYYEYVLENSDSIEYVTFYIYAQGEDGEEHRLISGYDIAFAVRDGKYYAFG